MPEQRQERRRREDATFLPDLDEEKQMEFLMGLGNEERERMQLWLHLDTRKRLFAHMEFEEPRNKEIHEVLMGDEKKGIPGLKDTVAHFRKTEERLNTWLNGACFFFKTFLPWGLGITATVAGLGRMFGWW